MSNRIQNWIEQRRLNLRSFVPVLWGVGCCAILGNVYQHHQALHGSSFAAAEHAITLARISPVANELSAVAQLHQNNSPDAKSRALRLQVRLEQLAHELGSLDDQTEQKRDFMMLHKQMVALAKKLSAERRVPMRGDLEAAALCNLVDTATAVVQDGLVEKAEMEKRHSKQLNFAMILAMLCSIVAATVGVWQSWTMDRRFGRLATFATEKAAAVPKTDRIRHLVQTEEMTIPEPLPNVDEGEKDIVKEFLDKLSEQMSRLRMAAMNSEFSTVAEIAAWLSGAAGIFGFEQFTKPSRELEEAAATSAVADVQVLSKAIEELADQVLTGVST